MQSTYKKFDQTYSEILPSKIKNDELDFRFFIIQQGTADIDKKGNYQEHPNELKPPDWNNYNMNSEYVPVTYLEDIEPPFRYNVSKYLLFSYWQKTLPPKVCDF